MNTNIVFIAKRMIKTFLNEENILLTEKNILLTEKNIPNDPSLWSSCKSAAKRKFDVYPSAYANAFAAKQYKAKGGTWKKAKAVSEDLGDNKTLDTELLDEKKNHGGLDKWFDEKWVDISKKDDDGKHPACGRDDTDKGAYPKCRKSAVAGQMSDKDKANAVARKRKAEKEGETRKSSKPNISS